MGDLEKQLRRIIRALNRAVAKRKIHAETGKFTKELVTQRTKKGFGVDKAGGKKNRLPKLRPSTKNIRQGLKKTGQLDTAETSPSRSNFTRSGKTLDEMFVNVESDGFEVKLSSHGRQAVKDTSKISKKYNFMNLSRAEIAKVKSEYAKALRKELKKFIK